MCIAVPHKRCENFLTRSIRMQVHVKGIDVISEGDFRKTTLYMHMSMKSKNRFGSV